LGDDDDKNLFFDFLKSCFVVKRIDRAATARH